MRHSELNVEEQSKEYVLDSVAAYLLTRNVYGATLYVQKYAEVQAKKSSNWFYIGARKVE